MLCYLGQLAGCTLVCPRAAVFTHSQPHKPLGHQLDSGVGPGVAKAMEGVKDLAYEGLGYKWPRLWSGSVAVDNDVRPGNVYLFEERNNFSECLAAPHPDPGNSQEHGNQEAS
jgi:hypothetical protein